MHEETKCSTRAVKIRQVFAFALTCLVIPSLHSVQLRAQATAPQSAEQKHTQQSGTTVPDQADSGESNNDDDSAEMTVSVDGFHISIQEIKDEARTGLDAVHGQLEIKLSVTNGRTKPINLTRSQWAMSCNTKVGEGRSAKQHPPLLQTDTVLKPGEKREGWMAFPIAHPSTTEPLLELTWKNAEEAATISLNDALRTTSKITTELTGPNDCLAIIQVHRPMDHLLIWLLTDEFRNLKKQDIENVVLEVQSKSTPSASTFSMRRSLDSWLISVQEGGDTGRFTFRAQVKSPVQFKHFYATGADSKAGLKYQANSSSAYRYTQQNSVFTTSREHAVANAVRSIYEQATIKEAMAALHDSEPGIQRAALEANIDRLDETQLAAMIDRAMDRGPSHQTMVAENLYRVSFPLGATRLSDLVRSSVPEVSQAALRSLVRSVSPEAAQTLKKMWREPNPGGTIHRDIVTAIMGARDHRHLDLLTEFAEDFITAYSVGSKSIETDQASDSGVKPSVAPEDANTGRSDSALSASSSSLQNVLNFLRDQGETGFADFARRELMNIGDPGVQDIVMNYILGTSSSADGWIVRQYIEERLASTSTGARLSDEQTKRLTQKFGPRLSTRGTRISQTLLNTIAKYPSPDYTDRLVELSESTAVSMSFRPNVFRVAVRCATDDQLSKIVEDFPSLNVASKSYLLSQLAVMQHPDWITVAQGSLQQTENESLQSTALSVLRNHGSPEATELIVNYLEELRPNAEKSFNAAVGRANPRSLAAYRMLARVLPMMANSTYPEMRRAINRCNRSKSAQVSSLGYMSIINYLQTNPNRSEVGKAWELRKTRDYKGALEVYNKILERDPYYSSGYVSRASLRLRDGQADGAMEDLRLAEELDPENALIESLIALTEIRQGNVEEGLRHSEEILESIPDLTTPIRRDTIYNTACAYGRASEVAKNEEQKNSYLKRGMELLNASVDRKGGFDDVQHALDDPDLNAFHTHPEWSSVLERIGKNEKAKPGRP